jgi:hypothetical protein
MVRFAHVESGVGYKMESYIDKRLGLTPGTLLDLWRTNNLHINGTHDIDPIDYQIVLDIVPICAHTHLTHPRTRKTKLKSRVVMRRPKRLASSFLRRR